MTTIEFSSAGIDGIESNKTQMRQQNNKSYPSAIAAMRTDDGPGHGDQGSEGCRANLHASFRYAGRQKMNLLAALLLES